MILLSVFLVSVEILLSVFLVSIEILLSVLLVTVEIFVFDVTKGFRTEKGISFEWMWMSMF